MGGPKRKWIAGGAQDRRTPSSEIYAGPAGHARGPAIYRPGGSRSGPAGRARGPARYMQARRVALGDLRDFCRPGGSCSGPVRLCRPGGSRAGREQERRGAQDRCTPRAIQPNKRTNDRCILGRSVAVGNQTRKGRRDARSAQPWPQGCKIDAIPNWPMWPVRPVWPMWPNTIGSPGGTRSMHPSCDQPHEDLRSLHPRPVSCDRQPDTSGAQGCKNGATLATGTQDRCNPELADVADQAGMADVARDRCTPRAFSHMRTYGRCILGRCKCITPIRGDKACG